MDYKKIACLSYLLINQDEQNILLKLRETLGLSQWQIDTYLARLSNEGIVDVNQDRVIITERGISLLNEFGIEKTLLENLSIDEVEKDFFSGKRLEIGEFYIPKGFMKKMK